MLDVVVIVEIEGAMAADASAMMVEKEKCSNHASRVIDEI
jgi:hypothetical protein